MNATAFALDQPASPPSPRLSPPVAESAQVRTGVQGLVLALAQVLHDVLEHQALRRFEAGSLTPDEGERVGRALFALQAALAEMEADPEVATVADRFLGDVARTLRSGLAPASGQAPGASRQP